MKVKIASKAEILDYMMKYNCDPDMCRPEYEKADHILTVEGRNEGYDYYVLKGNRYLKDLCTVVEEVNYRPRPDEIDTNVLYWVGDSIEQLEEKRANKDRSFLTHIGYCNLIILDITGNDWQYTRKATKEELDEIFGDWE